MPQNIFYLITLQGAWLKLPLLVHGWGTLNTRTAEAVMEFPPDDLEIDPLIH